MANPDPEITPEEARAVSPNAIIATGRSDYPNQVNNVLGLPLYLPRRARRARQHDQRRDEDRRGRGAGASWRARTCRTRCTAPRPGGGCSFGPEYIIPNAFDPRLISRVPPAVAKAAMDSGVARRPLADLRRYARELSGRLDPTAGALDAHHGERARQSEARGVRRGRGGKIRARRGRVPQRRLRHAGADRARGPRHARRWRASASARWTGSRSTTRGCRSSNREYMDFLYKRLQRRGFLQRDCQRMVNQDRNVFAACMVATGDADAHGDRADALDRGCLEDIGHAIDPQPGGIAFGLTLVLGIARQDDLHRRHADAFPPECRGTGRDRGAARRPRRATWATSRGWRCCRTRRSAIRRTTAAIADARRGGDPRSPPGGFRIRRRDEPGRGAGTVDPRAVSRSAG